MRGYDRGFLPSRLIFRKLTRDIIITYGAHTQKAAHPQDTKAAAALLQIKTSETLANFIRQESNTNPNRESAQTV